MGDTGGGVGHGVSDHVVGGGDTSVWESESVSSVSSKTVGVGTKGTVSIGVVEEGWVSLGFGLSISGSLSVVSVWVAVVSVSVSVVSVWSQSIAVVSVVSISISLRFSIGGSFAVGVWVSVDSGVWESNSLSDGIKSLSDWVKTGAGSEGDTSSIDYLRVSVGVTLAVVVGGVWVSVVGVGGSSTGDGDIGGVHAGGGLSTESIGTIGVWSEVWGIVGVSISVS